MQSSAQSRSTSPKGHNTSGEEKTVHVQHGVTRELLMIALVVALGVLAAAAILLPAVVAA